MKRIFFLLCIISSFLIYTGYRKRSVKNSPQLAMLETPKPISILSTTSSIRILNMDQTICTFNIIIKQLKNTLTSQDLIDKDRISKQVHDTLKQYESPLSLGITLHEKAQRLLEDMIINMLYEIEVGPFSWCICTPEGHRLALNLKVLEQLEQKRLDPYTPIELIMFGSAGLLQEYLLIQLLLKAGYENIKIILIDLDYPEAPQMSVQEQQLLNKYIKDRIWTDIHYRYLVNKSHLIEKLTHFKQKMSTINPNSSLSYTIYDGMDQYLHQLEQLKKVPSSTSSQQIFVMVDPDVPERYLLEYTTNYPSLANIIRIKPKQTDEQPIVRRDQLFKTDAFIFIPRNDGISIYENTEKQSSTDESITLLKSFFSAHPEYLKSYKKEGITQIIDLFLPKESEHKEISKKELTEQNRLVFLMDPHLSFQELIMKSARDNALIVTLYNHNPERTPRNDRVEQTFPQEYKTKNFVSYAAHYLQKEVDFKKVEIIPLKK